MEYGEAWYKGGQGGGGAAEAEVVKRMFKGEMGSSTIAGSILPLPITWRTSLGISYKIFS